MLRTGTGLAVRLSNCFVVKTEVSRFFGCCVSKRVHGWMGFTVASSDRDVDLRSTSWGASSVVRARDARAMMRSAYFIVNDGE